jgi:surface antigen
MKPGRTEAAVICLALMAGPSAFAFDVLGIGDMPIRYMTEEDLTVFKAAVITTLDQTNDGASASWTVEKTGAHGTLTPIKSFIKEAKECRKLEVANSAGGRDNRSVFTLCKLPDGDWKVEKH